jgi:hypothetical protein
MDSNGIETKQAPSDADLLIATYNWYDFACFLSKNKSSFANVPNL